MKFAEIDRQVKGVPFIPAANARFIYDLIIRERLTNILELGIAHGTATCYMAAALDEMKTGKVTAVDLFDVKSEFAPSAEAQIAQTKLGSFAEIVRTQTGYTWFLHDEIRSQTKADVCEPKYDLCIIDGAKNWTVDGCAFFLADKLMKEGAWLIFDDYMWTYAAADSRRDETDGVTHHKLSESERNTPHIREIFELLVEQHPNYSHFEVRADLGWVFARKIASDRKTYTVAHHETYGNVLSLALEQGKRAVKWAIRR